MRTSITSAFGVPGESDNVGRVVEFCVERGLCVSRTYFVHSSLNKYTRVARCEDGVEVKNRTDLVMVK